ncbi:MULTISPECIES: DUF3304 domain-containing protein [Pseudomonas]|jgi:hypothetical protein|uniref:DUF3304 domain-containing protein n=1 Tax=Pseudomonas TaxID=286 RepID=UPI0009EED615|nr:MULTISPECIES: DUF3304 domain-containing protein [Pseudomonas]
MDFIDLIDVSADARRRRTWRRRQIALGVLALVLSYAAPKIYSLLRTPGAMLTSENHTDRPITFFWVNDLGGGNLFAMGSGGVICCQRIEGETVRVSWILGRTGEQLRNGVQKENHEAILPLPRRERGDDFLHVRFLPGNIVELKWSPNLISPFDPVPDEEPKASNSITGR